MKQTDVEHRVRRVSWPTPSENLRARVMASAFPDERFERVEQPITWSDRMWFSRGWRLAFIATVIVAFAIEAFPSSTRPAEVAPGQQALAQAEARVIDETVQQLGLPPDVAASLVRRSRFEAEPARMADQERAALQEFGAEGDRQ